MRAGPRRGPTIHGYVIVCRNDHIADADGAMPESLKNDADWRYFQEGLDRADLIAIGRRSHEATPNVKRRRRLVLSRRVAGLEERPDGWWWNPAEVDWPAVVARLCLSGKHVAVPGGQTAFDAFLTIGYDAFHLSRATRAVLDTGRKVFSGNRSAEAALMQAGLSAWSTRTLDMEAGVTLTVYKATGL